MMKKLIIIIAAGLAFSFSPVTAAEVAPSHAAAIGKMLIVLQRDKQYEASMMAMTGFENMLGFMNARIQTLSPEERAKVNKAVGKMKTKIMEIISWEKVKKEMIEIHAKIFTEKEAAEVIALMDCPTGQMLVTRQMSLASEVERMMKAKVAEFDPQISKILSEGATE